MSEIIIFKLIFNVWIIGVVVFSVSSLSEYLFTMAMKGRFAALVKSLCVIPFWPLAMFSPAGRALIANKVNKI